MHKWSYEGVTRTKWQIIAKYMIAYHNTNNVQSKAATATEPSRLEFNGVGSLLHHIFLDQALCSSPARELIWHDKFFTFCCPHSLSKQASHKSNLTLTASETRQLLPPKLHTYLMHTYVYIDTSNRHGILLKVHCTAGSPEIVSKWLTYSNNLHHTCD